MKHYVPAFALCLLALSCLFAAHVRAQVTSSSQTTPTLNFMDMTVVSATAPYHKWTAPEASHQSCLLFEGKTAGDQITFSCPVGKSGVYYVDVSGYTYPDGGRYDFSIDNQVVGAPDYAGNCVVTVKSLPLAAGDHTLTLRLTGVGSGARGGGTCARPIWIALAFLQPLH